MSVTHTTVYKDYSADSFAAAAAEMLLDPEVWDRAGATGEGESILAFYGDAMGGQNHYVLDHWEWDQTAYRLRAWFR